MPTSSWVASSASAIQWSSSRRQGRSPAQVSGNDTRGETNCRQCERLSGRARLDRRIPLDYPVVAGGSGLSTRQKPAE